MVSFRQSNGSKGEEPAQATVQMNIVGTDKFKSYKTVNKIYVHAYATALRIAYKIARRDEFPIHISKK